MPGRKRQALKVPSRRRLSELPDVLTVVEAAEVLRVSRNGVYEALRRHELDSIRLGRKIIIPKRALVALLGVEPVAPAAPAVPPSPMVVLASGEYVVRVVYRGGSKVDEVVAPRLR